MAKKLAVLSLALFLGACSKPTIDASTEESMKASIVQVRESLPQDKRAEFDRAMQIMTFSQVDLSSLMTDGAIGADSTISKMKSSLNGGTGEQVMAEAGRITQERKAKEREQALAEIKELQGKQASAKAAKADLSKFQVIRSRFYKEKRDFIGEQPVIELTVRNGTAHAVSRAYFVGTLASANRSVPWMKDDFNHSISAGLEPGEEKRWTLAPNMFSNWGSVDAPADAILTVEVEQLDGADGKTLFSTRDFTEDDAQRLAKLLADFPR